MKKKNLESAIKIKNLNLEGTLGPFSLSRLNGSLIVLYFYPKDHTSGCTLEGKDFSRLKSKFEKAGAKVFGISRDSVESHKKFIEKQNFSIDLLSDENEKACAMFDVIHEKNMYGKKMMGIVRSTFVIGRDGKIMREWRKVKVPGHAQEVLDFINSIEE